MQYAWLGAIENAGARGKFKRALKVYMEHDIGLLIDSLQDAPAGAHNAWIGFAGKWAENEVMRILVELRSLDHFVKKAAWEKARVNARRESSRRLETLENDIIAHVREAGGAINFTPAVVARRLSQTRQSLDPVRVRRAMEHIVWLGNAKQVRGIKGQADRFVLLN